MNPHSARIDREVRTGETTYMGSSLSMGLIRGERIISKGNSNKQHFSKGREWRFFLGGSVS